MHLSPTTIRRYCNSPLPIAKPFRVRYIPSSVHRNLAPASGNPPGSTFLLPFLFLILTFVALLYPSVSVCFSSVLIINLVWECARKMGRDRDPIERQRLACGHHCRSAGTKNSSSSTMPEQMRPNDFPSELLVKIFGYLIVRGGATLWSNWTRCPVPPGPCPGQNGSTGRRSGSARCRWVIRGSPPR